MNLAILSITVCALIGVVPIVLAHCAKRFDMSGCAFSNWILLVVILSGLTAASIGCNLKLKFGSATETILVYEVILPDELQSSDNPEKAARDYLSSRMKQTASVLKKRIDPQGKKNIEVRQCGKDQIEIVIPEDNPDEIDRVKKLIPLSGTLEFRILASADYPEDRQLIELAGKSDESVIKHSDDVLGMWIPIMVGREDDFSDKKCVTRTRIVNDAEIKEVLCIKDKYDASGLYLNEASVGTDNVGGHCVNFRFNKKGADLFGKLTEENTPDVPQNRFRQMGIILNGELFSNPRIYSPIRERGQITGPLTYNDAHQLADALNSGALPVTLSKEPILLTVIDPVKGVIREESIHRPLNSSSETESNQNK